MTAAKTPKREGAASRWLPAALVLAALVSPGAWLVMRLPPVPVAKALHLMTVGAWAIALGLGAVAVARPDRRVLMGIAAAVASVLASFVVAGDHFQVFFYDLYGNMPLVQWLAFPAMFVMAASLVLDRKYVETALVAATVAGSVLASAVIFQGVTTRLVWVFGSTGYSSAALAPLIPVAVILASKRSGSVRVALYAAGALIAAAIGVFSWSTMGTIAALFAVLVSMAIHPITVSTSGFLVRIRVGAVVSIALLVLVVMLAQLPFVSGTWVNQETMASVDRNLTSRAQMWHGAQAMLGDRPLTGFGPSGYRLRAVEYLTPEALQFGPDSPGNVDPTVYSPQSPHSFIWEIATRLGLFGVLGFGTLLVMWILALKARIEVDDDTTDVRLGLAGGVVCGVFTLFVNPVLFPIGLFMPVAAGIAVAPIGKKGAETGRVARAGLAGIGVLVIATAIWLHSGESRSYAPVSDNAFELMASYEETLRITPGHPPTERRLLEMRLFVATDDVAVREAQAQVDAAPRYIHDFAPNLVSLAGHSLSQAERTGRTDLSWERSLLDRAAERTPPIPSLVVERLRLAVLVGDSDEIRAALPEALRWGTPYPSAEFYVARAQELLAESQ